MEKFKIMLSKLESGSIKWSKNRKVLMEFHINRDVRKEYGLNDSLFSLTGNVIFADLKQCREMTAKFNKKYAASGSQDTERFIKAGHLYAMGLIDEILHYVVSLYREEVQSDVFETALDRLGANLGEERTDSFLNAFSNQFPPKSVYKGEKSISQYLSSREDGDNCRALSLEETMLLSLANLNPAFKPFKFLFDDKDLSINTAYPDAIEEIKAHLKEMPVFSSDGMNLWDLLRAPALASPDSLFGQLDYMRKHWGLLISKFMSRLLMSLDVINEESKPSFFGPGPSEVMTFAGLDEYERFSPDLDWMPRTVLIAKSTLVWLFQLSQKYRREISRLDQIPDEELDMLASRGFTGLWLIGIWERSQASRLIKQWTGNPDAAASAYSLNDYDIAGELGGWEALAGLRERCIRRGIRLGSDMVPNHTGIDSRWIIENPDRFLQLPYPPFPAYNYNCGNLSGRADITVQIEEHYFSRSDAAVVFKRIDNHTGETRYIYHGNDGTSMPWNDTAQIDFLNPEAREAVIRTIIGVCKQFSIVRFDAAMTLAKRHIQRLWFPSPGTGGAIASRAEHAISTEEFNSRIPNEFWREVVDRCAVEAPNTLLLAEAFWMMEGYFVRTLGMHRVYNSAFMNMLKNEENDKYRATIKNTMEFDPEILKRFVNFMNNPDEDTAVAQFGKGDKYFGICTLLVTMPGLPMFGHGQIEGFEEKYGMEYRRSYRDEIPDGYLVDRHEREIFPLMKRRSLFSGSSLFRIYDLYCDGGSVNENVFAYSNRAWIGSNEERALVFYNNSFFETAGWIRMSDPAIPFEGSTRRDSLSEALAIHSESNYFTLFREQKSNLWYVRSSKAISENGFFVGLKGYETQVFLDIYEVEDDKRGRWARLNHDLNGKGVDDPRSAINDIFLGELYYRFTEIFKPEIVSEMDSLLSSNPFDEAVDRIFKAPVEAYIKTAAHFIKGADGAYDEWFVKDKNGVKIVFTGIDNNLIWDEFKKFMTNLKLFREILSNSLSDGTVNGAAAIGFTASQEEIASNYNLKCLTQFSGQLLYTIILSYGALSLLMSVIGKNASNNEVSRASDAANLAFDHWDLGRKLRNIYRGYGISDIGAWRITDIIRAVISRTENNYSACSDQDSDLSQRLQYAASQILRDQFNSGDPSEIAALVIEKNYNDDDFKHILGINLFDDAVWFNKEGFEDALFYSSCCFMIDQNTGIPVDVKYKRIAEIFDVLTKAKEKSGYRFDRLLDILTSRPVKKKGLKIKEQDTSNAVSLGTGSSGSKKTYKKKKGK